MKSRFAQVEPTTRCNYTCGFCVGRQMPQQDLPLERFREFLEKVEGLEALELQGEGEPLIHPQFFDMVALARRRFPEVEISMISNGSLFTRENIDRILEHGIARIFVSVESVRDEDFQRIRGGKLDRVRRGVRALLQARNERGMAKPIVGLSVTALKSTVNELSEGIPAFYRELGMDGGINVQPLQAMPQYAAVYDETMTAEIPDRQDDAVMSRAFQDSEPLRAALKDRLDHVKTGFYERLYSSVDTRFQCPWLANGLYMATGGELVPCCHVKDYQRYALASVSEDMAVGEAQRSEMRRELSAGRIPEPCEGCSVANRVAANARKMRAVLKQRFR
jgi:MoaA/NifB/PqqE/SkfB family radical SAM enzyme